MQNVQFLKQFIDIMFLFRFDQFLVFLDSDWIRPLRYEFLGYFLSKVAVLLISLRKSSQVESCHLGLTVFILLFLRNFQFLSCPRFTPLHVIANPLFAAFSAADIKKLLKISVTESTALWSSAIPFLAKFSRIFFIRMTG